jgi:shikimate kinase / 3-dehydroquinate synthase
MAPLVALAGFMGSGKSSVGALVAGRLGWRFVDLDEQIVRREGIAIAEFFGRHGEASFRRRELETLREILAEAPAAEAAGQGTVVALGGGTLQSPEAAGLLEKRGGVVLLDVDVDRAWERARGESRPLAQDPDAFRRLLAERRPTYERAADWILPVGDRGVEQLAQEIARLVRSLGDAWAKSWGIQLIATARPSTIIGGQGSLVALGQKAAEAAARGARILTITDQNVEKAWGRELRELVGAAGAVAGSETGSGAGSDARAFVLVPGEASKTAGNLEACWEWLAGNGARREDIVLALGGGVVGDLAGFAAATYQRGVALWQVPTSLLAQVDSSVGGKTAIDLRAGKNLAGAFYQPDVVVIDPRTLSTLPQNEFINGLGEVVKYGLLAGEELFGRLESETAALSGRDPAVLGDITKTCVRYKAAVVGEDEFDTGRRAVLNLGHTTAHALEVTIGYGRLGHGQAVALGLLVALAASERLLGLDPVIRERTRALLQDLALPVRTDLPPAAEIQAAAAKDKKVTSGSSGFVGLRELGEPVWKLALPDGLFLEALEVIRA